MVELIAIASEPIATIQLGSVSDWVSGVATAVGVLVALAQSAEARKQEQRRAIEVQRSNALAVTAEFVWAGTTRRVESLEGTVSNGGATPVFELQVIAADQSSPPLRGRVGLIPAGQERRVVVPAPVGGQPAQLGQAVAAEVRFRDVLGTIWASRDGVLTKVKDSAS